LNKKHTNQKMNYKFNFYKKRLNLILMSLKIIKKGLSHDDILKIKEDCTITGVKIEWGPSEVLRAYGETENSLYVPFAYSKTKFKASPNKDIQHDKSVYNFKSDKYPFRFDGGRDQEVVFNEAVKILKKNRSVLLSLFCGFGKCLAYDTPIIMWDGTVKKVQDIVPGDLLMGDDNKPRQVLTLGEGFSKMYEIKQAYGDAYIVNEDHILTLQLSNVNSIVDYYDINNVQIGYKVKWFDFEKGKISSKIFYNEENIVKTYKSAKRFLNSQIVGKSNVIDITLKNYLEYFHFSDILLSYKPNIINFEQKPIYGDPFHFGATFYNIQIPPEYKTNTVEIRQQVLKGICSKFSHVKSDHLYLPITGLYSNNVAFMFRSIGFYVIHKSFGILVYGTRDQFLELDISVPVCKNIKNTIEVKPLSIGAYYGFTLDGNGRFLLGDFTVTHNTYTGIRLAHTIGLKTAILAHRGILFDQWIEAIDKFTEAKVQKVDTDGLLDPQADFYIFNMAYVHKKWNNKTKSWMLKNLGLYKNIGTLIVDEAHVACASEMSRALLFFNPRFAIALTATPIRKDGMDKALELYFGKYSETQIIRISQNPFIVYRYNTRFKPEFKMNAFGKKDWNSVIDSITNSEIRNEIIIELIKKYYEEYNILLLTKRTEHCRILQQQLNTLNINSTVMTGSDKTYDKSAKVLLSTFSKLGVGFDDSRLNMLIVASSVTEVEQYAGRLRDSGGNTRIVIDLVDDDSNCIKHWSERRKWYISRKGIVKNYTPEINCESEPEVATKRLSKKIS